MDVPTVSFPPLNELPGAFRQGESWACLDLATPGMGPVRVEAAGPFAAEEVPPDDGWAVYANDFALSEARPWRIPAAVGTTPARPLAVDDPPEFAWEPPDREAFARAFREIVAGIRRRDLLKAVPVSTQEGRLTAGNLPRAMARALHPDVVSGSGRAFARVEGGSGFAGISPEILFRVQGRRLTTMALAGTADAAHESDLRLRPKIAREHEIVVDELRRRLSELGEVAASGREVLTLGTVRHLRTRLSVDLPEPPTGEALNDLIRLVHPTPALGISPRTPETLRRLQEIRSACRVPAAFGAPFGFSWPGGALFAVAIRGLFWEGDRVFLPAGCGIVAGSELEPEWDELELKRAWVASALDLRVPSPVPGAP